MSSPKPGAAFLLAQIGAAATTRFAATIEPLGLIPAQAGLLRLIAANPDSSQQVLAGRLGAAPSRVVGYLDELEQRGVLTRRPGPDRRVNLVALTDAGRELIVRLNAAAAAHEKAITAALSGPQRTQLRAHLATIADSLDLQPGIASRLRQPVMLRPVRADDATAVRDAQVQMAADDFDFALFRAMDVTWADYVDRLRRQDLGDVPPELVPASFLVATVGGQIVGRSSVRHRLNDWLLDRGGHIGYCVLPAHRRRGHATEILRQSLVIARARGVDRVLVTCDDTNAASRATIERCGGRLDADRPTFDTGNEIVRRYWIDDAR